MLPKIALVCTLLYTAPALADVDPGPPPPPKESPGASCAMGMGGAQAGVALFAALVAAALLRRKD